MKRRYRPVSVSLSTFLCRNVAERTRLLDLQARMRPAQLAAFGLALLSGLIGVGTIGWVALIPSAVALTGFAIVSRSLARQRHPERVLVATWAVGQIAVTASVALAHGPGDYLLILPAIPMTLSGAVMPARVGAAMTAITALLILGLGLTLDTHEVLATPPVLLGPLVVLLIVAASAGSTASLDIASRRIAATDHLTGLPNRFALQPRISELAHQAAATGERVAVLAIDVDHLKTINDQHGHAAGDRVLREIARRLRVGLAPFDSIYRFGGEEFLALLAGYDVAAARAVADRMCRAVRAAPIDGLHVTVSIGVAVPHIGEPFHFEGAFARADAALYEAKRGGRDTVRVDTPGSPPTDGEGRGGSDRRRADRFVAGARQPVAAPLPTDGGTDLPSTADPDVRSWLIGDALEREHMLELSAHLRPLLDLGNVAAFLVVAASGPWFGWTVLIPPIFGAGIFQFQTRRLARFRRPEYPLAFGWLALQLSIAAGFTLSHGRPLFALTLLVLAVPGTAALFPPKAVALGVAITAALITGVAFDLSASAVQANPAILGFPLVLLAGSALMGLTVGRSALGHRSVATVDQLTGTLNRIALTARATELESRSALSGGQVAIVLGDVDAFKSINDEHGHAVGDRVLALLAGRMRSCLRTFESVYRLGGEEFIVLLPGVDIEAAAEVAERLRAAVAQAPIEGHPVTMSFGVAASGVGERFSYEVAFAEADDALLMAKRSGRDRVIAAGPTA